MSSTAPIALVDDAPNETTEPDPFPIRQRPPTRVMAKSCRVVALDLHTPSTRSAQQARALVPLSTPGTALTKE